MQGWVHLPALLPPISVTLEWLLGFSEPLFSSPKKWNDNLLFEDKGSVPV